MAKPIVGIIGTGGTIASKYDPEIGGHVPAASAEELVAVVPELHDFAEIHAIEHSIVSSASIDTPTVFALRDSLRKLLADENVAGAVVTHGTATLEETAYLMDLTLGANKPVVVTGGVRNFDEKDSDGPRNLLYAAKIAADPASSGRGVLVSLGGEIHSAREVVKAHTQRINAFSSRDGGIIGMVSKAGVTYFSRPERRLHLEVSYVKTNVQFVVMTQGSNDLLLRACIQNHVDGIVVDGVGGGNVNVPCFHAVCDALHEGIPVVISARPRAGPTHLSKAFPGSLPSLVAHGAIPAGYLSGIKARILLMVALAYTHNREELRNIFARA